MSNSNLPIVTTAGSSGTVGVNRGPRYTPPSGGGSSGGGSSSGGSSSGGSSGGGYSSSSSGGSSSGSSFSNLPTVNNTDSGTEVKQFFNNYFNQSITFPVQEIDAVIGFFKKRGFDDLASNSTAIILLQQAKLDDIEVFKLIDTLTGLNEVQLSAVVTEVLNYNRQKISTLGYRQEDQSDLFEKRNILV